MDPIAIAKKKLRDAETQAAVEREVRTKLARDKFNAEMEAIGADYDAKIAKAYAEIEAMA